MLYTNMYSNIIVYQKYLVTSFREGCTTRSVFGAQVQRLKESPLTIRGDEDQGPLASEEF